VEPNNTFADANTVNFGTPFNASINPAGDQDYFKFVVTQAGVVNVNLSNVPSNIPMRYRFYNTNQQLVTDFNYAAGINFTRQQLVCEPGVYYLRLSANSTSVSNAAQYTVLFTFDTSDVYECNNVLGDAALVQINQPINASIWPAGDQDYYKFEVTQAGVVSVTLSNIPSNIPMRYRFYNATQQLVTDFNYAAGVNFVRQQLVCRPGIYYLQLNANSTTVGNANQYTALITFDTSDVYECNNVLGDAALVQINQPINASIWPAGDQDYYKFEVTQPGVISVALSNIPSNIPMRYRFYNANQQLVTDFNYAAGVNFVRHEYICTPGIYYLQLLSNSTSVGNPAQYTADIMFVPDIYECNNSLNTAKQIQLEMPINATIWPANDEDFFKVEVLDTGVLRFIVTDVPTNVPMNLRIYGVNQQLLYTNTFLAGQSLEVPRQITTPGIYFVRLTSSVGNPNPYSLLATMNTTTSTAEILPAAHHLRLYPNPAQHQLYLDLSEEFSKGYIVEVANAAGQIVLTANNLHDQGPLDISRLAPGIYFVKVRSERGKISAARFVKK